MKRLIISIQICAYLVAAFHCCMPHLSYVANYDYFATEACINKHNPELQCNGYCQLQKMVEKQHQHNDAEPDEAVVMSKNSSTIFYCHFSASSLITPANAQPFYVGCTVTPTQYSSAPSTPPPRFG